MRKVKAFIRVAALAIFSVAYFIGFMLCLLPVKLAGKPFEALRNRGMRFWSAGICFIFNVKVIAEGKAPEPPFILVLNHLSYLDIVPVFLHTNCTFVAKKEVLSWPVLGYMVKNMGVIFVDRARKRDVVRVNGLLRENLNVHQGITLFPEGTSSGGENVYPFRSPLLEFPSAGKIPVHTAALRYETGESDLPARDCVCFYGARESFAAHVFKMAQTRSITCYITFGERTVMHEDRKELAKELHEEVSKLFVPTDTFKSGEKKNPAPAETGGQVVMHSSGLKQEATGSGR